MHHESKKPLIYKDFRLIFNDKKKTVGRYDCINLLFLIWCGWWDSNPQAEALAPKTSVFANFTTSAFLFYFAIYYIKLFTNCQNKNENN